MQVTTLVVTKTTPPAGHDEEPPNEGEQEASKFPDAFREKSGRPPGPSGLAPCVGCGLVIVMYPPGSTAESGVPVAPSAEIGVLLPRRGGRGDRLVRI